LYTFFEQQKQKAKEKTCHTIEDWGGLFVIILFNTQQFISMRFQKNLKFKIEIPKQNQIKLTS